MVAECGVEMHGEVCGRPNADPRALNQPCSVRMPRIASSAVAEKASGQAKGGYLTRPAGMGPYRWPMLPILRCLRKGAAHNNTSPAQRRRQEFRRMCFLPPHRDLRAVAIAAVLHVLRC